MVGRIVSERSEVTNPELSFQDIRFRIHSTHIALTFHFSRLLLQVHPFGLMLVSEMCFTPVNLIQLTSIRRKKVVCRKTAAKYFARSNRATSGAYNEPKLTYTTLKLL